MVCELDAGRPNHHVPRFHRMAAISNAKTMAKPVPELTLRISSTRQEGDDRKGDGARRQQHSRQIAQPDETTAICGGRELV